MATFLRPLSYQYQWLYDSISRLMSIPIGGENRFRQLALKNITLNRNSHILDLCCGSGQTTQYLVRHSDNVVGLDASLVSLNRAKKNVPQASYVEGLAQKMPFNDNSFDLVHTSVALHEMTTTELDSIFQEVHRVLKPEGIFTFIDLHKPYNPIFMAGLAIFMWLFETETAWQLIKTDLSHKLKTQGFKIIYRQLYLQGSLEVIQAQKVD